MLAGCGGQSGDTLPSKVQNTPAELQILNSSGFIGVTVSGTSIDYTASFFAAGGLDLENLNMTLITSDPIAFKGGTYPGTGGTCGHVLHTGEGCSVVVSYDPTSIASHLA